MPDLTQSYAYVQKLDNDLYAQAHSLRTWSVGPDVKKENDTAEGAKADYMKVKSKMAVLPAEIAKSERAYEDQLGKSSVGTMKDAVRNEKKRAMKWVSQQQKKRFAMYSGGGHHSSGDEQFAPVSGVGKVRVKKAAAAKHQHA